jgi:hypothetical protein
MLQAEKEIRTVYSRLKNRFSELKRSYKIDEALPFDYLSIWAEPFLEDFAKCFNIHGSKNVLKCEDLWNFLKVFM